MKNAFKMVVENFALRSVDVQAEFVYLMPCGKEQHPLPYAHNQNYGMITALVVLRQGEAGPHLFPWNEMPGKIVDTKRSGPLQNFLTQDLRYSELVDRSRVYRLTHLEEAQADSAIEKIIDEKAIEQAKRNGNLNQQRINWVHCDAFSYTRQMQQNSQLWDVVVLDPPKFVLNRDEYDDGRRRYEDLNQLAISLVKPGGVFVTCSCSGLVQEPDFERMVIKGAHRQARKLQFLDRTGAGADHPVLSNCPESRYLKVLWARVF